MDDQDRQIEFQKRGEETLRRLHRLVRKGYAADLGRNEVEDAIFLDHLAGGPPLILYGSGLLVAVNESHVLDPADRDNPCSIGNRGKADALLFDQFLATVREPSQWERARPDFTKYILTPGCAVVMIGTMFAVASGAVWLLNALTGWHLR
jgi:hypothetical protein